ncbi:MAG: hypothetical protein VX095_00735 [Pseudomonadota bacterium]|nr:hypothetical protein [Pseudomonadota bacterium]
MAKSSRTKVASKSQSRPTDICDPLTAPSQTASALTSQAHPYDMVKLSLTEASKAFLIAALLLTFFYFITFRWIHPEFDRFMERGSQTLVTYGRDFIPISVGEYRKEERTAVIGSFNDDEAILVLNRQFEAEDFPFIKVNLSGVSRYTRVKILWRQINNLSITHALELNRKGSDVTQVAMAHAGENYSGTIADIALLFYDGPALAVGNNDGRPISVESLEFRAFSAQRVARQIFDDWTTSPLWSASSSNKVRGVHWNGQLFPNAVTNLVVILALGVTGLLSASRSRADSRKASPPVGAVIVALCLCGWIANESLRWLWRVDQLSDTFDRYSGLPLSDKIERSEVRCGRSSRSCKRDLLPFF